ncbi:MAG: chromosomal replication initiator protein DnaA [Bryobacterales bacterium]|nr:chromosomal replication initiator protein DnaA [Bryobacterales bacterium]
MNLWDQIRAQLETLIPAEPFATWILPASGLVLENGTLRLSVPDEATKVVLREDYGQQLALAAHNVGLDLRDVEIQVRDFVTKPIAGETRQDFGGREKNGSTSWQMPHRTDYGIGLPSTAALIERYNFDNFVVGPCNQFAHAACRAVASKPAGSYNPLFLYGGTGVGKTHLMHAIGLALGRANYSPRIVYTSSERFVNDMVTCIKQERMPSFHAHYRSADVLLIDDIHIIAGKERTQEEFFHTFNELYEHKKQIVISSDSAPKEIPGLVERLRSRFEWGLMVDMQPPDLETKMAILDKKAEAEGVPLPEDVRIYIATRTKSNVRELEGALVKVLAYSSLSQTPITLPMVKRILSGLDEQSDRKISIDAIQKVVASRFKLQQHQLRQRSNVRSIAYPRQIAMYLAKELTGASLTEIGRAFGGKHHTTVLHSVHKISEEVQSDPEINKLIHNLSDSLK